MGFSWPTLSGDLRLVVWTGWERLELCFGSISQCHQAAQSLWFSPYSPSSATHTEGCALYTRSNRVVCRGFLVITAIVMIFYIIVFCIIIKYFLMHLWYDYLLIYFWNVFLHWLIFKKSNLLYICFWFCMTDTEREKWWNTDEYGSKDMIKQMQGNN